MLNTIRDWFGFGPQDSGHGSHGHSHGGHGHSHGPSEHGHTHGVIDPTIASTERGIWAIKWSFIIMASTAVLQLVVVLWSGSVALLADTIHNFGDATTAIPLWIAFILARRKPSKTFNYGLGRVEDLAGVLIVLIILFSAIVAGYEAINRLLHPEPISQLWWVAAAGVIGFIGNEAVAVFRIRIGREINSAALIADGYHARTDGLTSLAVVLGAIGVALGFPLADPIIGLLITLAIFGIVWQSARAVFTRMLDGVEPDVVDEIRHSAQHVDGVTGVTDAKARWIGHELVADVAIAVDEHIPVSAAQRLAAAVREELFAHLPALRIANVRLSLPDEAAPTSHRHDGDHEHGHGHGHHHAPDPFDFVTGLAEGQLAIIDTADGERMRLTVAKAVPSLAATVDISRPGGVESLVLHPTEGAFISHVAPEEPHEFDATLNLAAGADEISLPFHMSERGDRHH